VQYPAWYSRKPNRHVTAIREAREAYQNFSETNASQHGSGLGRTADFVRESYRRDGLLSLAAFMHQYSEKTQAAHFFLTRRGAMPQPRFMGPACQASYNTASLRLGDAGRHAIF
jgi:hypothetical protein